MKKSKEEILKTINESEIADELKISLMEDITDSFEVEETTDGEDYKAKYEELSKKYKERFFEPKVDKKETEKETETETEDKEDKEIIDVKEI